MRERENTMDYKKSNAKAVEQNLRDAGCPVAWAVLPWNT